MTDVQLSDVVQRCFVHCFIVVDRPDKDKGYLIPQRAIGLARIDIVFGAVVFVVVCFLADSKAD